MKGWMSQREYKRRLGCCPACGGDDVVGEAVEIIGQTAEQRMFCNECFAAWADAYDLKRYYILSAGGKTK